jgi:hypothetical protein
MQQVHRARVHRYAINALRATKSSPLLSSHVLNNLLFDNMALRMHFFLSSLLVSTKEEAVSL